MARGTPDWGQVTGGVQGVAEFPTYAVSSSALVVTSGIVATLSLFNPVGSGKIAKVIVVVIAVMQNDVTGSNRAEVMLARTSSMGTGDVITPVLLDTTDAAASCVGREFHTVAPTWAGNLGPFGFFGSFDATAGAGRISSNNLLAELYRHHPGQQARSVTLREGQGIGTKILTPSNTHRLGSVILFTEEPA